MGDQIRCEIKWKRSSRIHRSTSRTLRPLTSYLKAHLFSAVEKVIEQSRGIGGIYSGTVRTRVTPDKISVEVPSVICHVFFWNSISVHYREVSHYEDAKPWNERCDIAFSCTTRNEIEKSDAVSLVRGSTMACTSQAVDVLRKDNCSNKGCLNRRGFKLGYVEHTSATIVKKYGAVRLTFEVEGLTVLRTTQIVQLREKLVCIIWMMFCERKLHRQMPLRGAGDTLSQFVNFFSVKVTFHHEVWAS
ncbi:hypothetical protein C5167_041561 [Papaver somniferum]|nr:hypothetical protein C5167_041561 [Papaver somniferum]